MPTLPSGLLEAASLESSSLPKYLQLAEEFARQIRDGELAAGERLPSFLEMRSRYGVTPTTVERVYSRLEREGLVRREARRGVYVTSGPPNSTSGAKGPGPDTRTRNGLIGLIGGFGVGRDLWSDHIVDGVQSVLGGAGKQLVLLDGHSPAGLEKIDGLLICSTCLSEPVLQYLPPELPCVSLLSEMPGIDCVLSDDYKGAHIAAEHLIRCGHRRIGCMMEFSLPLPRLRLGGYHDALTEAGIVLNPRWMRQPRSDRKPGQDYFDWGREGMREWLEDGWASLECTALFVQNDQAAGGVMEVLQGAGLRVPGDVSIIGFDGTDLGSYFSPRLTSIEVPLREVAERATRMLLQQIESDTADNGTPAPKVPERVVLSPRLKERDSVTHLTPADPPLRETAPAEAATVG